MRLILLAVSLPILFELSDAFRLSSGEQQETSAEEERHDAESTESGDLQENREKSTMMLASSSISNENTSAAFEVESSSTPQTNKKIVRVMTFNTWISGANVQNGLQKIAKHINAVDPDIVALQEITGVDAIGGSWNASHQSSGHLDTAILTKHEFVDRPAITLKRPHKTRPDSRKRLGNVVENDDAIFGTGATIKLGESIVNFFSMHLEYRSYGPYAAHNKLVTSADQIMAGEYSSKWKIGRAHNIRDLLANDEFNKFLGRVSAEPLIVAGDFNCPSHLDWITETKDAHGGWVFEWPATKLMADAGFLDSFRALHPNVTETPGITWSTVQKASGWEWDYSIDFILYKAAPGFKPAKSYTYAGSQALKPESEDYQNNDYPSDHYSVVTEFEWNS